MNNGTHIDYKLVNDRRVPFVLEHAKYPGMVEINIVFANSGSITDKVSGESGFLASLLGEGTSKKPFSQFHEALEQNAIDLSAYVGNETMGIMLSFMKEDSEDAIKYLKELLSYPNFSKEAFEKVKRVTKGGLLESKNDFDTLANELLDAGIFASTPLQLPQKGTLETLEQIKLGDLEDFYLKRFNSANAIVVMGGDYDDKLLEGIQEVLKINKPHAMKPIAKIDMTSKPVFLREQKDTQQAYIYFASPFGLDFDDAELYKAKVALFILGSSGFGSRLMEEIRVKRGLAYSAYAYLDSTRTHTILRGYMQTALDNEKESIKVIKQQFDDFVKKGVSEEELKSAKDFILGSEPLRSETLGQRMSSRFNEFYKQLGEGSQERFLKNVKELTIADLNKFIASHQEILELSFGVISK